MRFLLVLCKIEDVKYTGNNLRHIFFFISQKEIILFGSLNETEVNEMRYTSSVVRGEMKLNTVVNSHWFGSIGIGILRRRWKMVKFKKIKKH